MSEAQEKPNLRLALVQSALLWHDPAGNRAQFEQLLANAQGADLVILPEMFTTSFSMQSQTLAEAENGPTSRWLLEQAGRLGAVITGSLITRANDGSYRNRLLWATPQCELGYYDKRHLFRMAGEHDHYRAGEKQVLFEVNGWRVRPLVCYDLRFPVGSRDPEGTDLLLYVANWPVARRNAWNRLLPARAIENLCYVAAVNRIGKDGNGHAYCGDSQVLDFKGDSLLQAHDEPGVFTATLMARALEDFRQRFPAYQDADDFCLK